MVLQYFQTDGCTYSNTITIPIVANSKESLLCDLESAAKKLITYHIEKRSDYDKMWELYHEMQDKNVKDCEKKFEEMQTQLAVKYPYSDAVYAIGNELIHLDDLIRDNKYHPPQIYTIDEWFELYGYGGNEL